MAETKGLQGRQLSARQPLRRGRRRHDPAVCACLACILLAACRERVKSWEGVVRILATYFADPGRQGQKLIKEHVGTAWRCRWCDHETEPTDAGPAPHHCPECGGRALERVSRSVHYLGTPPRGRRSVFLDPYRVSAFKMTVMRWAVLAVGEPKAEPLLKLVAIGFGGDPGEGRAYSERSISAELGKDRKWVHEGIEDLKSRYETRT